MNEEPNSLDREIVVKVFEKLLKYGGVSTVRLNSELNYNERTVRWAMYQLGAVEKAGLWVLNEYVPVNWR